MIEDSRIRHGSMFARAVQRVLVSICVDGMWRLRSKRRTGPDTSISLGYMIRLQAQGELFLIVGAPAVGKSSTSRSIASRFEKGIHIPVDDLRDMVVSGQAMPSGESWPDQLADQVSLARAAALHMAEIYVEAGFGVVIDDFVDPHLLREYAAFDSRVDVTRVILAPDENTARDRNAQRARTDEERSYIDSGITAVYEVIREHGDELESRGWVTIDNSILAVGEAAEAAIAVSQR